MVFEKYVIYVLSCLKTKLYKCFYVKLINYTNYLQVKKGRQKSPSFVYLVIFYEVDKKCFYSEALFCVFVEKSNVLFLLFSHLLLTNLKKTTWNYPAGCIRRAV